MTQISIYDAPKQRGIEVSYANASTVWKEEAGATLQVVAKTQKFLTSEDVITVLEKKGVTTGNNKAMGGVMQAAHRIGLIRPTGEWRSSKLARRHAAPLRVWESTTFRGLA